MFPGKWRLGSLSEIGQFKRGKNITAAQMVDGKVSVISVGLNPSGYHNEANVHGDSLPLVHLERTKSICCTILMIYGRLTARIIKMKINYGLCIMHCCFYSRLLAICNVVLYNLMFILKTSIKFQ